jgi:hypothetical protein
MTGNSDVTRLGKGYRRSIPNPCHHFPNRRFWTASEGLKKKHLLDRAFLLQSLDQASLLCRRGIDETRTRGLVSFT